MVDAKNSLISIVIPTFNQGPYIGECLNSICRQTYKHLEIVIQDSCSTDSTEKVCRDWAAKDSRIKYIREKDLGQSDAINRGLKVSTGKYFTWICSDDFYWTSDALEKLVLAIEQKSATSPSEVEGAFGRSQYVNEKGTVEGPYYTNEGDLTAQHFQFAWPLAQPGSLWLREAFTRVNGVDPTLHLGMDLDLFIRILKSGGRLIFVDHPIACVRNQPNAKSVSLAFETAVVAYGLTIRYFGEPQDKSKSVYARQLIGYFPNRFPERMRLCLESISKSPVYAGDTLDAATASFIGRLRRSMFQAAFPQTPKILMAVPAHGHTRFPWIPATFRTFVRKRFLSPLGLMGVDDQVREQSDLAKSLPDV